MQLGSKVIELFQLRPLAFAALCMFGLQPLLLQAEVIADKNAATNNRPLIDTTANNLPLVQITTPSAAGVSRNQYSQFNVDPGGVILNNSQVNVLTQQGGYVGGNPYLANGSARIILNEVTGTGASSLRGYTEVAGQRAEVIIANPNGIVCDGCGFINTSRGILTTGVPMMGSGGSLDSFRVTGGQIQIGAGGLNASNIDQLDLITRSLKVNGEIWANNLNAVIGANQVDYTTLGVQVIAGDANKPTVGIDVALLGGMYANKIRLVGTEAGVGVNSLGTIAAQAGDFTLDNRGNVTLNGHTSSSANLVITTQGDLANTGTLEGNTVNTISNGFNNTGAIQADTLTLTAASLSNQGADAKITAVTLASVNVTGDINNAATLAGGALSASSQAFNNTGAVQADVLTLHATSLSNLGADAKITANTSANLTVTGDINNEGTLSGGTLTTNSNAFKNTGNVLAGVLSIDASSLKNLGSQAKIVGNNSVNLTVAGDINNEGTLAGATFTTTSNAFNNSGAVLANELTLNANSINNQGTSSSIAGNTSVDLNVSGNIDNAGTITGGTITSTSNAFTNTGGVFGDVVTLNANSLNNQGTTSLMAGNSSLELNITGDINNAGTLDGNTVTTHSQTFKNTGGIFGDVVTINATNLNNTSETAIIAATSSLNLIVSNAINNLDGATLYSMGSLNAGANSVVDADGYLSKNMVSFNNRSATVQADGDLRISADQITNKRKYVQVDVSNEVAGAEVVTSLVTTTVNYFFGPITTTTKTCLPCYIPYVSTESVDASTTAQSNLLAGGNMWLKGAINNEYSTIAAGGNITFNANGSTQKFDHNEYSSAAAADATIIVVGNSGANSLVTNGYTSLAANGYTQLSHDLMQIERRDGTNDNPQLVVVGRDCNDYLCTSRHDVWGWQNFPIAYKATIPTLLDSSLQLLSASFTAGKNISGSATIVSNLSTNAAEVSATLGALQSSTATALQTSATPPLNITLPKNGLFKYNTAPGQAYLIETNTRFASYRNFISSDYMLSRLTLDPQQTQRRLGDGFYEQKLVSDQITNLTGRRFLPQYTSAEAEFIALMEQGIAEAHTQNLIPGVTLTTAQVVALTHDIVWMVAQEVSLPDGKKEKLLVPQVFLTRLQANDLRPNGSLIAADNIDIKVSGTLQNSGTILGSKNTSLSATDVVNQSGTISSIGDTVIVASNDIKNLSGSISGRRLGILAGHDIVNDTEMEALQLGNVLTTRIHNTASIAATESIEIRAGHDVTVTAAKVVSGGSAILSAGNNLTINYRTATETAGLAQNANNSATNPDGTPNLLTALRIFSQGESGASGGISTQTNLLSQIQTGTDLTLSAHNDIKLTAAQIYAQQNLTIAAQNITLDAVKDVKQSSFNDHRSLDTSRYDEKIIGSALQAGGNVTLAASSHQTPSPLAGEGRGEGGNINISGSQIASASGKLTLAADNNVTVNTVDERHDFFEQRTSSSSGFLSSSSTTEIKTSNEKIARGSSIDGESIRVKTGHDINVIGSDIVATKDLSLEAKNNINLQASENTYTSGYFKEEKKSGLMSGSGLSISYGDQKQKNIRTSTDISHTASNIGSLNGSVNIKAGQNYTQTGSNVVTPQGDINIAAQEVLINEVHNTGANHSETKAEQSGLTLALTSGVVDAVNSIESMSKAASQTKSGRMKALAAANAAMTAKTASAAVKGITSGKDNGLSISLSYGGSTSESSSTQQFSDVQGSNVTAGGNIHIVSASTDKNKGNLTIQGSNIKSGNDTTLEADNTINLLAAQSTASQHSTNSSSSGSLGIGFNTKNGLGITASGSMGRGNADGEDVIQSNTHVDAGNTLTLKSGKDTNLKGAVASGKQVVADIGGNLNVESLQDTSEYESKQKSQSGSVTIGLMGGKSSASYGTSHSNIDSTYASVMEQSGIKAGDGGYSVKVKGNTDIKGAVIASSDTGLTKSTFTTGGKLTQSDIQNSAEYKAESISVGVSTEAGGSSAGFGSDSGNAKSITKSGVGVSTKTDTTGAIKKIFNADTVTAEVNAQTQITQSFSQQAPKAVADYAGSKAKDLIVDAKNENDPQKKQTLLDDAAKWDEGGVYRVALHTVSGALSGGVAGAAGAVTTASAAPLLDDLQINVQTTLVKQGMSPEAAKLVAQGVADVTAAGMGYAAGGLQGAGTGLTVDANNRQLHEPEKIRIAQLANGDSKMAARLEEAACSMVHCAAEYPADSQERRYYEGVELRGQSDSYALQQLADAQKVAPALFSYGVGYLAEDKIKYVGNTFIRASDKLVDFGTGAAKGAGKVVVQTGALALDAAQLAGVGAEGDGSVNIDPYSDLGKAIKKDGVVETVSNIPGNTLRGVSGAIHSVGQGDLEPLGEVVGGAAVPIVAGKVVGRVGGAVDEANNVTGLGRVTGNYSAIEPGPLMNNLAETFSGGRYTTVTLQDDTILYRAGTNGKPLGEFFSLEPSISVLQTRIDKAVLPEWPSGATSPVDTSFAVKIPAGTQVHIGEVGTQSGFYIGGTQQVVVSKPWTIPGVHVINSSPLK